MAYKKMKLVDFPEWIKEFKESPYKINLNLVGDEAKLVVAISENEEEATLGADCIRVPIGHCGGTIVVFSEGITLFSFAGHNEVPTWREDLVDYLQSKNIPAEIVDNDILIDNFKIAGAMSKWLSEDIRFYGIHISIRADAERIKEIVKKPMVKIPKGLADYGVTRAEVLEALRITEEE